MKSEKRDNPLLVAITELIVSSASELHCITVLEDHHLQPVLSSSVSFQILPNKEIIDGEFIHRAFINIALEGCMLHIMSYVGHTIHRSELNLANPKAIPCRIKSKLKTILGKLIDKMYANIRRRTGSTLNVNVRP